MRYFYLSFILFCGLMLKITVARGAEQLPFETRDERSDRVSTAMSNGVSRSTRISISPMVGLSMYEGRWNDFAKNQYSFGLALDVPVTPHVSAEVEAEYGKYFITYLSQGHDFTKLNIGSNLKVYLFSGGLIRPYLGAGMMAMDYIGMQSTLNPNPYSPDYNKWIGAAQVILGVDVAVAPRVALGLRGSFVKPLIGLPDAYGNGVVAYRGYEEAAAINTSFFRFMGTVKVML